LFLTELFLLDIIVFMKNKILNTIMHSFNLIISPDVDGFISARLLQDWDSRYKVVGTYDKNILTLAEDIKMTDCLFLDCDMNRPDLVSIGNHMRLVSGDNISDKSFNPNVHFGTKTYTDKYPLATAYLISAVIESPTSDLTKLNMAYADSTYKNLVKYSDNMNNWRERMKSEELERVFNLSEEDIEILIGFEEQRPIQAYVSKRYGKKRYMGSMNEAMRISGLNHAELVHGFKYLSDKVGKNTVLRYSSDMISYAEIYGGEYSVTYDQEIKWT